jgi:hypothetical protein
MEVHDFHEMPVGPHGPGARRLRQIKRPASVADDYPKWLLEDLALVPFQRFESRFQVHRERPPLAESFARSSSARRASRFSVSIALDRVVQDAVCSSNLHGSRGARVYHHFPQRRNGRSGHLVEPPHGLGVCGPFRRPIKTLELRLLLPAPECSGTDSNRLSCIFDCPLRKQGSSGGFLLMGVLCPVAAHLRSPAIICPGN